MTTASLPDPLPSKKPLNPGEINVSYISDDWPLTPLQGKKAYIPGWTKNPFTVSQIKRELEEGRATGVGLLCGQFCNEYGLLFVDIDGEEAIPAIEELGNGPIHAIFPATLTISSGKKGKFRMIFRIPNQKIQQLPDRATLKLDKNPWEILWRSRQGAIMGAHPDTDGYRTNSHGGFEYVDNLPDMPDWLYQAISNAYPSSKYRRRDSKATPFISQNIHLSYEENSTFKEEAIYKEACEYLDALNLERCNDYEQWIAVGMSLHQTNEDLLGAWIEWSMKSKSFESGACEDKWKSFERLEGGPNPEGSRGLHTLKAMAKEDGWVDLGGYTAMSFDEIRQKVENQKDDRGEELIDHLLSSMEQEGTVEAILNDNALPQIAKKLVKGSKSRDGKLRNPPSSAIAEYLQEWALGVGWCYDPRFDTFMYYMPNRGFWSR